MTVTINLLEWDVTYTELAQWAMDTGATVRAVTSGNFNYEMEETDYTAFKIKFKQGTSLGYKAAQVVDRAFYYCPYIPIIKPESIVKIDCGL